MSSTVFRTFGICILFSVATAIAPGCVPSPCQNGGICYAHPVTGLIMCQCQGSFTGNNCSKIDPCLPQSCANGGICLADFANNNFTCQCLPGFTGHNCSSIIDQCDSNPCMNGRCVDHTTKYVCECPAGYSGINCESYIGLCDNSPCNTIDSKAVCKEEKDKSAYQCDCSSHSYFGLNCEAHSKSCAEDEESYCICNVNNRNVKFLIPTPTTYEGINWRDIVSGFLGILLGWLLGTVLLHCCKCCIGNPDRRQKPQKPWTRPDSAQSNSTVTSGISSTSGTSRNQVAPVETARPMNVYRAAFGDELTHTISVKKSEETYITGKQDWRA